jgi:hypothetical protein
MRGPSELAVMERNAINTLASWKEMKTENNKWSWFFRSHLWNFVNNITFFLPIYDPFQALLFGLLGLLTAETFMAAVDELCNGFSSLALAGSNHPVMVTFNNIIPGDVKEREQLVIFSDLLANFRQNNPQMDDAIIPDLYALRNYYLMKGELEQSFAAFIIENQSEQRIEDIFPLALLEKLGITPLFPILN